MKQMLFSLANILFAAMILTGCAGLLEPAQPTLISGVVVVAPTATPKAAAPRAEAPVSPTATAATPAQPAAPGVVTGLGELYVTAGDPAKTGGLQLVHLAAGCAVQMTGCAAPQAVASFPNRTQPSWPLSWAPDGKLAGVVYPTRPDMSEAGLFLFNPLDGSWNVLLKSSYLVPQVNWSSDGQWIVFQAQEEGGVDTYAVHPDGSGLANLTAGRLKGPDAVVYVGGWLKDDVLIMANVQSQPKIYRLNVSGSQMSEVPVPNLGAYVMGGPALAPAPDGSRFLLTTFNSKDQTVTTTLLNAAGTVEREMFSGGSPGAVYDLFSPDSQWMAFLAGQPNTAAVYLARADGSDAHPLLQMEAPAYLSFSPDSKYLVVEGVDGPSRQVVIIDVAGGQKRILQGPGLGLGNTAWEGISWQPLVK